MSSGARGGNCDHYLQFDTAINEQSENYVRIYSGGVAMQYLPLGPVQFPLMVHTGVFGGVYAHVTETVHLAGPAAGIA